MIVAAKETVYTCVHQIHEEPAMGLSTHVLDTMNGCPATGMQVELYMLKGGAATLVKKLLLNADGRTPDGPLYKDGDLKNGSYRLVFDVAAYFKAKGAQLP